MLTRRGFFLTAAAAGGALVTAPRLAFAATPLAFSDLYQRETVLTPLAEGLAGQPVQMTGYMAPPLKAEASFFVLTAQPMAVCPFCETELQWPDDIVLVLTSGVISAVPFNRPIRVEGVFETGFTTDPETGFVSFLRITNASFQRV
ncbi:MAG: hypothetical protein AB7O56_08350 [Bauldia sp.]